MAIYGVAILAFCYFAGNFVGDILGAVLKVKANVGGVGFAMLFLILLMDYLQKNNMISKASESGVAFWSAMYIPIVVAMTAQQNVLAAIKSGPLAILSGTVAVLVAFLFVPVLGKITKPSTDDEWKK